MPLTQVQGQMLTGGALNVGNNTLGAGNASAFKNRIINGAMQIDQRNSGASVSSHLAFPVDRFQVVKDTPAGTFTAQQSSVAPTGFVNSLLFTVGTAYTPSTSQNNFIKQIIEGFNTADLNWGTANAQTVTLSFWVRSSLTGTFGASLRNGASNRSYPFSYAISAANTWEYKTVTIPGDTTGTWLTTNGNGIEISWGLSVGSTFSNTAGSWYAGNFISTTGAVMLTSTAGATWQITGVQLEVGSTATSFDYRPYGTELQLCQRYFWLITPATGNLTPFNMSWYSSKSRFALPCPVPMRATPTVTASGSAGGFAFSTNDDLAYTNLTLGYTYAEQGRSYTSVGINGTTDTVAGSGQMYIQNNRLITISAEL